MSLAVWSPDLNPIGGTIVLVKLPELASVKPLSRRSLMRSDSFFRRLEVSIGIALGNVVAKLEIGVQGGLNTDEGI